MTLPDRVAAFCRESDLIHPGDRVVAAVSGGADSVALLWALCLLRDRLQLRLEAAHFNHKLRGAESDRDEAFVRALCDRCEVPLTVGSGTVCRSGRGLEDAARRARYAFFETLPEDALVATAHTADDNAETVLLHLLRGTGLRGLGGVAPVRGRFIRPMLGVTRAEVEAFLEEWNLRHVEDSSNAGSDFLRNRIRHEVMPFLRQENPRFSENTSRMALSLRRDAEFLDTLARETLDRLLDGNKLPCAPTLALHEAVRSRVLALYLRASGVPEPEAIHLETLEKLLRSDRPSAGAEFPGGLCLERQYGFVCPRERKAAFEPTQLHLPGLTRIPGWCLTAKACSAPELIERTVDTLYLSEELAAEGTVLVRSRSAGDRIRLSGGSKSLKKAMIDCRIPAAERDYVPLIAQGDRILFAWGIGAAAECRMQPGTAAYRVRIEKTEGNL